MAANLDSEAFWRQTPRTFVTIMEGCNRAANRRLEDMTFIAFQAERMAREKRPKLKTFLDDLKPKSGLTGADMLGAFKAMKKQGATMKITKLKRRD